jgi:hypothetical protein
MESGPDGSCQGVGGYSDISAGKAVVVYNQSDRIIGSGQLSQGKVGASKTFTTEIPERSIGSGAYTHTTSTIRDVTRVDTDCIFTFSVPTTSAATFYRIEVANRGKQVYPAKDLVALKNRVALEIGN